MKTKHFQNYLKKKIVLYITKVILQKKEYDKYKKIYKKYIFKNNKKFKSKINNILGFIHCKYYSNDNHR